jgi:predicted nucleic acid-binding protein
MKSRTANERSDYLDACVLDESLLREVVYKADKRNSTVTVSHLALGEAFGTAISKHGREKSDALIELISDFIEEGKARVVGHDRAKKLFDRLSEHVRLDFADSIHVGTALHCRCDRFVTTDPDILERRADIKRFDGPAGLAIVRP